MTDPLALQGGFFPAAEASRAGKRRSDPSKVDDARDWERLAQISSTPELLRELFERHKSYVHRVAWGVLANADLADDVTQEVFLRLARGAGRFRPRARFTTFLYRLTINTSRELARRQGRHQRNRVDLELDEQLGQATVDAESGVRRAELLAALAELSLRQREVLVLRHFEGFSTRETARILGCRQGTVKTHLHRAMIHLARRLNDTPADD